MLKLKSLDYELLQIRFRDTVNSMLPVVASKSGSNRRARRASSSAQSQSHSGKRSKASSDTAHQQQSGQSCPSSTTDDLFNKLNIYKQDSELAKAWHQQEEDNYDFAGDDSGYLDEEKQDFIAGWLRTGNYCFRHS